MPLWRSKFLSHTSNKIVSFPLPVGRRMRNFCKIEDTFSLQFCMFTVWMMTWRLRSTGGQLDPICGWLGDEEGNNLAKSVERIEKDLKKKTDDIRRKLTRLSMNNQPESTSATVHVERKRSNLNLQLQTPNRLICQNT